MWQARNATKSAITRSGIADSHCHVPLAVMASIGYLKNFFRRWQGTANAAYQLAPVGLATFSEKKQSLTQCNPLFSELLGYKNSRECMDNFLVEYHLMDDACNQSALSELRETNILLGHELNLKTVAGAYRRVKCNMHRDLNRRCIEIAVFPPMEEPALLNSERVLNPQLQQKLIASIAWDLDFRAIEWNKAAEAIFGYSRQEALNKHITELILNPEWKDRVDRIYKNRVRQRRSLRFTNRCRTKFGKEIICELYISSLMNPDGKITGWRFFCIDITKFDERFRKLGIAKEKIEHNLKQSEQKLSFSMQMLNSSTWEFDLVNQTFIHSEIWAKTLGYDDKYSSTDAEYWFNLIIEEDRKVVTDAVTAHIKGETELYEVEFRIRDAENNEHWIRAWGKVIDWDGDGKAVRMLGINTDLTELKRSQQENNQLQNQLFQAKKMHTLGQLTGGFAHDFNNLLASIIGYTGLVLDKHSDTLDARIKDYLTEVYKAGQLGQKLVSQMLSFGRTGSAEMAPAMIGLLLKDVVQLLKPSLPSSITLEIDIEEQVPSVETNAFKLNQILMNLCINAKDAMEGVGTLSLHLGSTYLENVKCYCCGESMSGQFVQIQIADSGIGIAAEMLPHIFDPYFTTKEIGRGTGVGLSTVDNLMHEHGGHLLVSSAPRQGTTFKLLFPPCRQISAEATRIHLGKSRYQAIHRGHILVVDDDQSVGTYVAEVLKHHGHRVTLEFGSVKALERYQDNPYVFDVVVTDQTMPEMTGCSLMLAMKEIRKEIPVIICTAYSENLDADSARKAGAKGYLRKPIDVDELIELVDQSLAQNSSTAA